jgi:hypothetical protein
MSKKPKDEEAAPKKATVPHPQRRRNPVGVDPRRERRQKRAAERAAWDAGSTYDRSEE